MYNLFSNFQSLYEIDDLPPMHVSKAQKRKAEWKEAVMDAFEVKAVRAFKENLQFLDFYRMCDGKITFQELSEVMPHLTDLQKLLDGVGVPSFLKHHDIMGVIINAFVGQYINFRDKFHVTDTGEIAQNEYLREKNREFNKQFEALILEEVKLGLAERGFNMDEQRQFNSQEEQQEYMMKLEAAKKEATPEDLVKKKGIPFKTAGVKWGEATLSKDRERFHIGRLEKEELKHYLISGRPFRHFRITHDSYELETWDSRGVFTSGEIETDLAQDGEYVGRLHMYTPSEVISKLGHKIPMNIQKKLLGDHKNWKSYSYDGYATGSIEEAVRNNFNRQETVPFSGFYDYNFSLALQDDLGIPMGVQTIMNKDGSTSERERFLPRIQGDYYNRNSGYARLLRDDGFSTRKDLCQVTEVYFRAYDKLGWLTYIDEDGFPITEKVTEDILGDFLKENDIKQSFKHSLVDIVKEFTPGEIKWTYVPVVYYGVKIQSPRLTKPLYIDVEEFEHQIYGDSDYDVKLPVAGYLGKGIAHKIEPYQAKYNLAMNQMYSLMEKELGMFLLMDIGMIPSEYDAYGDSEQAIIELREMAKKVGIMPVATGAEANSPKGVAGNMAMQNVSHAPQIQTRIEIAEYSRNKAFQVVGLKAGMVDQPNKYTTAEGVRVGQEASYAQVTDIYEDFNYYIRGCNELHLSVAQYCQSNKKDNSLYFTKSDASIEFLSLSDPNLPLRRLGIMPSETSSKRKQVETFRNYILNNNTIDTDTLEVAELLFSDEMSVILDTAKRATKRRMEKTMQENQARAASEREKIEALRESEELSFQREETSKEKDRETKIEVATINALGRAADKQSDAAAFEQIKLQSEKSKRDNEVSQHRIQNEVDNFRLKERKHDDEFQLKLKQLQLKGQELEERKQKRRSDENIAVINKN